LTVSLDTGEAVAAKYERVQRLSRRRSVAYWRRSLRRNTFALLHDLCRCDTRIHRHKQVDVIGLDRQIDNRPSRFSAFLFNQVAAITSDCTAQNS